MVPDTPNAPDDLADRLVRVLACAAADPALTGVLLFDLEPRLLDEVARLFADLLTGSGQPAATPLMLGAQSRDEDLWTRARLHWDVGGLAFRTEPGPLIAQDTRQGPPPLAVVPDLTRLSVAGMRAAVQLLSADVAVVEHTGLRRAARPRTRWLAVCRSADAARLSPHLLDRFALRLATAGLRLPPADRLIAALPPAWRTAGTQGVPAVAVDDDALVRIRELLGTDVSVRRELALARLARTVAALDGAHPASAAHCDAAARLIGLPVPGEAHPAGTSPDSPASDRPTRRTDERTGTADDPAAGGRADQSVDGPGAPLPEPEPPEVVDEGAGTDSVVLATPFPEDTGGAQREFAPLRRLWQRSAGLTATRGVVVGSRPATDLRDLAYVPTVRRAAMFQRMRPQGRFTVLPIDLRSHLRAAAAERLLVLLLDHTCRVDDWDWLDALTPFLRWAYTARAGAQVIEIGGSAAGDDELRAESFAVRNVLDPRLLEALFRPAGRATPLAHGLDEAARVLRWAFQQHGSALAEAWLVVVTDGRGNVPLRASRTGRLDGHTGATGVEDAVRVARRIGAMDRTRVRVAVVDPGREPYGDLPHRLADSLGAAVVEGRPARETDSAGAAGER
ncbi:magnesium chelatase [Streptomyces sp. NPDC047072]|uniref:magnesium chelatase n=1 Tax=Streptomyces sp. NPDC047072 TaxID=3154809 RepID=UPI0033FDE785